MLNNGKSDDCVELTGGRQFGLKLMPRKPGASCGQSDRVTVHAEVAFRRTVRRKQPTSAAKIKNQSVHIWKCGTEAAFAQNW